MAQRLEAYIDDEYFTFSVRVHESRWPVFTTDEFLLAGPYFQLKVRAVSEWNAEGEWAVDSVPQTLTELSTAEIEFSVMTVVNTSQT